jgi:hypothetical protein
MAGVYGTQCILEKSRKSNADNSICTQRRHYSNAAIKCDSCSQTPREYSSCPHTPGTEPNQPVAPVLTANCAAKARR